MTDQVDLSPVVNEQLPAIQKLPFDEAIEQLHALERRCRVAKDDNTNCTVCTAIVDLCISQKRWNDLGNNVTILAKRRGYSRKSVSEIVRRSMDVIPQIPEEETKISLIKAIREVTEGKIFVEVERARLTNMLVDYLEDHNQLTEAMNLLQDLRLEILTTMEEKERISMMLHQFRLCLKCKDQLRASLCAEKIHDQKFSDKDLKLEYLNYLINYHTEFTHDYMEIARSFYEKFKLSPEESDALMNAIVAAVLAPHSDQQLRFCNEIQNLRILALKPEAKMLLKSFMGRDLIPYPDFERVFGSIIGEERKELMRKRVIEHGLRVISQYYTNIRLKRLAELLQLTVDELEERIIELVFAEDFYARIDRPNGIVTFKRQQKVSELADNFSNGIIRVCKLVDQSNSLIEKERQCIHRVKV